MLGGEDFLMRPVLRGMCQYESLKNGTIGLYDISIMNDALDVEWLNQQRAGDN